MKKRYQSFLLKSILLLFLSHNVPLAQAQQKTISGRVTDENNEALPGVSIVVKGTTQGTVTDSNGTYRINLGGDAPALVFSYVGYLTEEVVIGSQSVIDLAMNPDITTLQEMVVIGYGSQEKRDVTGAISSITSESIKELPVASLDYAMQGRAAGVQVITNSGEPGGATSIRIRGVGTVNSNEPLYVIDGVPIVNQVNTGVSALSTINPGDIESIDVLKDASATAIYGARAQNGVVIVTTKKGQEGKLRLTLDSWGSVNVLDRNLDMLGPQEWAQNFIRLHQESEQEIDGGDPETIDYITSLANGAERPTYDWLDNVLRNAFTQNHQITASGGNTSSQYYLSFNYFDQEGIFVNNDLQRYSARLNTSHQLGEKLSFGNTLTVSRTDVQSAGSVNPFNNNGGFDNTNNYVARLLRMNPFRPVFDADGNYAGIDDFDDQILDHDNEHPIWRIREFNDQRNRNRLLGSLYGEYEFIEGLKFRTSVSMDLQIDKINRYSPFNEIEGNSFRGQQDSGLSLTNVENRTWYVDNTLTYQNTFFEKHNFTVLAGYQAQKTTVESFSSNGTNFADNDFPFFNTPDNTVELQTVANNKSINSWVSFFGRVLYDFDNKYLLTATVRRDGSSRFGPDSQFGTFPAFSLGWRLSEEPFMQNVGQISNLKLRGGFGITGGESAGNYQFIGSIGTGDAYGYAFNEEVVSGATIRRLPNTLLQWEETQQTNVGIDLGLLQNRVEITADYFQRNTTKLFLGFAPPLEIGTEQNPTGNLGEIQNNGFELTVSSQNLVGDFTWDTDFNIAFINNEVIALAADGADRFSRNNITRLGEEIGAIFGYQMDGIFQNWEEVYAHAYQNQARDADAEAASPQQDAIIYDEESTNSINFTAPGDVRFVDQNGDGIIDPENDRTIIGSTIPDVTWGLSNTFNYKGIGLSIFIQGVHGVDIYNALRVGQEGLSGNGTGNYRRSVLDRWSGEGTSNSMPRGIIGNPNDNNRTSSRFVEDGSYIRIRNVRLSYNLPQNMLERLGIGGIQFYVTATNLATITDYSGYDPEIGLRNTFNSETAGEDNGNYPLTRQYTFGISANF